MAQRDTRALIAHLFRRAGFGLRPDELDHFTGLGVQASVDYLVDYDTTVDAAEESDPLPDLSSYAAPELPPAQRTAETQRAAAQARNQARRVIQAWWVQRMLHTTRPLQEKMTLFWHGHFATALTKARPAQMLGQNQLFRATALGPFEAMLRAVNSDPAMLVWLDGAHNRAGKPNENFSRELMELFTIGLGQFSENDVREGARALTGWTFSYQTGTARFVPRFHDAGVKTYLGHTGQFGADEIMAILAAHPATGPFMARKLFSFFAYDTPEAATITALADTYYQSNYNIKEMVRQILLSDAFYSDAAFQGHIKSPAEFVVGTVRELGIDMPAARMAVAMAGMGQELFNPANVGGWHGGPTWLNATTLVNRFNFAGALTAHRPAQAAPLDSHALIAASGARDTAGLTDYLLARFVGVGATRTTRAALLTYLGDNGALPAQAAEARLRGLLQLVLSAPEYNLN